MASGKDGRVFRASLGQKKGMGVSRTEKVFDLKQGDLDAVLDLYKQSMNKIRYVSRPQCLNRSFREGFR